MRDAVIQWLQNWDQMNIVAAGVLALVFILSGLVLVPRTFFCVAAGAVFGTSAIPIILPSTTLGGMIGFLLARYFFSDWLQRKVDERRRLRIVLDAVDSESWRVVGLLRLGSPIPTTVQNYCFGLTRIGLLPFTLASFFFSIPQVCLYVYLGAAGRAALLEDSTSPLSRVLMGIGVLTLLTVTVLITRKSRQALRGHSAYPSSRQTVI